MREKLIKLLEQAKYCSVEELADYLLEAGLVLPVRCKDCEFGEYAGLGKFMCELHEFVGKAHFYCADGARRTDERNAD